MSDKIAHLISHLKVPLISESRRCIHLLWQQAKVVTSIHLLVDVDKLSKWYAAVDSVMVAVICIFHLNCNIVTWILVVYMINYCALRCGG